MSRPWLLLLLGTEPGGSRGFGLGPSLPRRPDLARGVVSLLSFTPHTAGCPSGQWKRTVNPSRKLRRFESFTCHPVQIGPRLSTSSARGPTSFLSGHARWDPAVDGFPRPM